MTVLMLAPELDITADKMVQELDERDVPVFRADTAWFPSRLTLEARLVGGHWVGRMAMAEHVVELEAIRSVWYRTPSTFSFPDGLSAAERHHAFLEAKFGIGGVLGSLDALWVNHPNRAAAAYKPLQLAQAARSGLDVPATLVANTPSAVRDFTSQHGVARVVTKMLGSNHIEERGIRRIAFTRVLAQEDIEDLQGIRTTMHQLQPVDRTTAGNVGVSGLVGGVGSVGLTQLRRGRRRGWVGRGGSGCWFDRVAGLGSGGAGRGCGAVRGR